MHKSGEAFKLSSVSDKDWMEMSTKQRSLEAKMVSGTASSDDVRNLAMTYEVLDGASQKLRDGNYREEVTDADGNVSVVAGGASPASQAIIEQSVNNRAFKLSVSDPTTMEKRLDGIPARTGTTDVIMAKTFTTGKTIK
jgi:hypothetical protein